MIEKAQTFAAPAGRVLLSTIFLTSGLSKIGTYQQTAGWMDSMGVPGILLPAVILLEVVGALAVIVGWQTRIASFLLAGFTILAALLFHNDFSNQMEMAMFMKNLSIAGGFLAFAAFGAGAYSLDNRNASKTLQASAA